ncbi:YfhO family protein [Saccharicrinis aurantiacus]|uniref:YfhO family protein n=1 Tax=Saccharicrinis aurantiacus TaxID=1849719 RepID=UPI000838712D|nr:YfhO family protein [Saccharicrinis aurantiacus]
MIERLKSASPYIIAIVVFAAVSIAYFSPVLQNKVLPQMDDNHAIGMAKEIKVFEENTGDKTQWTNSMFGGMPSYQIKGDPSKNVFWYLNNFFRFGLPYHTVAILFLYLLGFYVFMLSLKLDKWLALIGAIAFAFGSYNLIIIIAGHITKAYTIALMGPVIAGILYTYNRDIIKGGVFTALALGMQIAYNHVQITYYLVLLIGILVITRLVYAIVNKQLPQFAKATGVLIIAAFISILPNITNLWTTYEYGAYSIRGKSDLAVSAEGKEHSGLDKDYALGWSLEPKGTFTLMIPNVVGGASEQIANNKSALEVVENDYKETVGGQSQYWGGRPFTSGPVYAGAIVCFLFMLGAFYYKGPDRWWLIIGTVFSFFLAWGKHFEGFTDFMFYYFPLYNKFRTVEMAMVVASLTIPTLGFLGLREIYNNPQLVKDDVKKFMLAFGLTGGVCLVFYLIPTTFFDFISDAELQGILQQKQQYIQQNASQASQVNQYFDGLLYNLKLARIQLLKADAFRSFAFILIGSGSIWLYITNKLSGKYLVWGLGVLILIDLWSVDKRYLSNDDFVSERKLKSEFEATPSDIAILGMKTEGDRVFSIYRNPFNEVHTSFHHQSIGGYHGAKLRRYQDVISRYLESDWRTLLGVLQNKGTELEINRALVNMPALNMLNAKYIVYNPNSQPIVNANVLGDAWFVKAITSVNTPDDAIAAIGATDISKNAVVNITEFNKVSSYNVDSINGNISLEKYRPNHLVYNYNSTQEQLAVFSQIYYPKGWNAYVDGEKIDILRANYILRAALLPAGNHTVEFKFEPKSYKFGQILAGIGSVIILLAIAYLVYMERKKK